MWNPLTAVGDALNKLDEAAKDTLIGKRMMIMIMMMGSSPLLSSPLLSSYVHASLTYPLFAYSFFVLLL